MPKVAKKKVAKKATFKKGARSAPTLYSGKADYGAIPWKMMESASLYGKAPLAAEYYCRHNFCYSSSMTGGIVGVVGTETIYQLNSLWQPIIGVSRQPYGMDTLEFLYGRYKVLWTRVEFFWTIPSADGVVAVMQAQGPNDLAVIATQYPHVIQERPGGSIIPLVVNGAQNQGQWTRTFDIAKMCGLSKAQFQSNAGQYMAAYNANPAQMPILRTGCGNFTGTNGGSIYYNVKVTYGVVWSGLRSQNPSS